MKSRHLILPLLSLTIPSLAACHSLAGETQLSGPRTEIYRSSEGRQCEIDSGISVHEMQRELTAAGIRVLSASCGIMTGVQFITVCGAFDGGLNVYTIPSTDLERALALGFQETSSLPGNEPGWQPVTCPRGRRP